MGEWPIATAGAVRGVAGSVVAQPAVVDSVMSVDYVSVTSPRNALGQRSHFALLRLWTAAAI